MITYYDNRFNQNEIFVLALLLFYIVVFKLPRRFPTLISIVLILFGIASAIFMDHAISLQPYDFYDVNDNTKYNIFDFLLYCGYGPFSYFMIYIFDIFNLKKHHSVFYITAFSLVALGFEWVADMLGVFHYKNGYKIIYSYPIYLVIFSILFMLYFKLYKNEQLVNCQNT
jgi:hypothetical protein